MTNETTARRALACLDLTDLGDSTSQEETSRLIARAQTAFGPVAAICIWPQFVSGAAQRLRGQILCGLNLQTCQGSVEQGLADTLAVVRNDIGKASGHLVPGDQPMRFKQATE